jgi:hypothetical protein
VSEKVFFVQNYSAALKNEWDSFINNSGHFTFQFKRLFLDKNELIDQDVSLIAKDGSGSIIAVFPIQLDRDVNELVSHSLSSYGGVVFANHLGVNGRLKIYESFMMDLRDSFPGLTFKIRLPPAHVSNNESEIETWILWRLGFSPNSVVLHSAVDLRDVITFEKGRVRRDAGPGIEVFETRSPLLVRGLWDVLSEVLKVRHKTTPVHTYNEIIQLQNEFAGFIRIFVCSRLDQVLGGLVFFNTNNSFHLQYMAVGPIGRQLSIGDILIRKALEIATHEDFYFFNFGHSNEKNGLVFNEDLWSFKTKFGSKEFSATTWSHRL